LEHGIAIGDLHRRHLDRMARSERQTRARWETLVAAGSGHTVAQIARELGMARQNVQRLVDALAEARLVRFEPNPNHRRSPRVELTPEGAAVRDRLERKRREWEQADEEPFDPEDIETALGVLRTLRSRLERSL
jgi:DNA-binding MarR family transcriptional regulator